MLLYVFGNDWGLCERAFDHEVSTMDMKQRIWSFDTDGVLNNYPAVWLEFIALCTGKIFPSVDVAKGALFERYNQLKHEYRLSDFKYSVPVNHEAKETIALLKQRGDTVYISTSRPLGDYPDMRQRTMEWLKKSGIQFDGFLEKNGHGLKEKGCMVHIDDEPDAIKVLYDQGIRCILYQRGQAINQTFSFAPMIGDLRELLHVEVGVLS